jgi:F-type H+-transporting ATPase subunit epsilon
VSADSGTGSMLHLEVVTPRGSVVDVWTDAVTLPGKLGEFGVLGGHIPFLSALRPGVLRYTVSQEQHRLAIASGFAEVGASHKVLVLTELHAFPDEIDVEETRQELAEAEAELKAWVGELNAEHEILLDRAAWAQARLAAK